MKQIMKEKNHVVPDEVLSKEDVYKRKGKWRFSRPYTHFENVQ